MVRHVIGKLDADPPLFCHHPHLKWRRACRKAVPEHRQPVSLGEVEEHCRITALGDDPSGGGFGLEPVLFKILLPHNALHSILSIEDQACPAVGIEHARRRSQLRELTSGFLATRAVAGPGQNRLADCLEFHLAALAHREETFALFLVHGAFPFLGPIYWKIFYRHCKTSATGQNRNAPTGQFSAASPRTATRLAARVAAPRRARRVPIGQALAPVL